MPLGVPIGFSGFFSREGSSVFSAQLFSESGGWRFSVISAIGVSGTSEPNEECFLFAMRTAFFSIIGDSAMAEQVARATTQLLLLIPSHFPGLRVFPGDVSRVVQVQQQPLAAIQKS